MIVKRFGCTAIHNKALYKCIIHSFIIVKCCNYVVFLPYLLSFVKPQFLLQIPWLNYSVAKPWLPWFNYSNHSFWGFICNKTIVNFCKELFAN